MRSILFFAMLAFGSVANAEPPTVAVPVAVAKADVVLVNDGDKLICRRENTIGSNIRGKKVCRTKRDMEAAQISGRMKAQEMSAPTGGGGSSN